LSGAWCFLFSIVRIQGRGVIAVEGNAESVPKIRITEKHFASVAIAKSAGSHPKEGTPKA